MIKRILWDLGNVVILADHVITHARLVNYGVTVKRATTFFLTTAYAEFARGSLSEEEFCHHQVVNVLQAELSREELVRAHDEHMWAIDESVVKLMGRVNQPIAVATDTNPWQTRRERELIDITNYADRVFRSNELGKLKRDPGAFAAIVELLDTRPQEIVLIDDSPEKVEQAKQHGLRTILFKGAQHLEGKLSALKLLV